MIRALLFLAVMIGLAGNGHAQITSFPEKPELLAAFVPENVAEEGGYIGGEIVFKLRLVSKRPFESLDFKLPAQIEGADLRQLVRPRTRRLRSYTGRGYVFEAIYGIYPHTSGTLKLPSLQASGTVPGSQPGGTNEPFIASLPATELRIHQQASAMESDWWMVSPQVTVSETLSKPEAEVRQGDIIRRHVTISAVGVPAERMPIPEHGHGRGHGSIKRACLGFACGKCKHGANALASKRQEVVNGIVQLVRSPCRVSTEEVFHGSFKGVTPACFGGGETHGEEKSEVIQNVRCAHRPRWSWSSK